MLIKLLMFHEFLQVIDDVTCMSHMHTDVLLISEVVEYQELQLRLLCEDFMPARLAISPLISLFFLLVYLSSLYLLL